MKHLFASADFGMVGLLFFFGFFCIVAAWTFRPGAKKSYQDYGDIPLNDESGGE